MSDPYLLDGRVITEAIEDEALSPSLRAHQETLERLGAVYKQPNPTFGSFGMHVLKASTQALSANDPLYLSIEASITALTQQRDELAEQIKAALNAAAFDQTRIDEHVASNWIWSARQLIEEAELLAF